MDDAFADFDLDRISAACSAFSEFLKDHVLDFRIPTLEPGLPARNRAAAYEGAMVDAANIAVDVEEQLRHLLVVRGALAGVWGVVEAEVLAKPTYGKWVDPKARVAPAINLNRDAWKLIQRLDAAIDAGTRAVRRLEAQQKAASRALGIEIGH